MRTASYSEIRAEYPGLYLLYREKIDRIRQEIHEEAYDGQYKPVEINRVPLKTILSKTPKYAILKPKKTGGEKYAIQLL